VGRWCHHCRSGDGVLAYLGLRPGDDARATPATTIATHSTTPTTIVSAVRWCAHLRLLPSIVLDLDSYST
jgi:hypothetical protein